MTTRASLLLRRAELAEEQARIDRQLAELELEPSEHDEYSTLRLPVDAKSADAFNRACRAGRVAGATKRGRVWKCTRAAWDGRAKAPSPLAPSNDVAPDVLAELGARRSA